MERKIGSKARIKGNLIAEQSYGGTVFTAPMVEFLGMEVVIQDYEQEEGCPPAYLLNVDDGFWSWNEAMLEDADSMPPFVKVDKPFLLLADKNEDANYSWLETEEMLAAVAKEMREAGYHISYALEIGSCRKIQL